MSEPVSFNSILDFAERDYASACRHFLLMCKDGPPSEQHRREILMLRTITNTLQLVGRDPDSFKSWAQRGYVKFGQLPGRSDPDVIEAERIARDGR